MKKALLIIGIIIIGVGVLTLLLGLLFMYVKAHTMDGSASLYAKQGKMMSTHLIVGAIQTVIGTVCLIIRGILFK